MAHLYPTFRAALRVAACQPVDTSGLPDGVPIPEPLIDDTTRRCQVVSCGQDIWVGPRKLELADAGQALLACVVCAVRICGPGARRDGRVVDLDPIRVDDPRRVPGP